MKLIFAMIFTRLKVRTLEFAICTHTFIYAIMFAIHSYPSEVSPLGIVKKRDKQPNNDRGALEGRGNIISTLNTKQPN